MLLLGERERERGRRRGSPAGLRWARQQAEDPLFIGQFENVVHARELADDVAVCQGDALWRAGRAAGVYQQSDVVARGLWSFACKTVGKIGRAPVRKKLKTII